MTDRLAADPGSLENIIRRFDVPPCPAVIGDLQAEMHKPHANSARIAQLISRDVGLSGAVMRLVKSPAFSGGREVGSIAEALSILGLGRVFDLVVGELLKKSLADNAGVRLERYWDGAACSADLCASLAGRLPGVSRETAYCFGLFHDCGIPLLIRRFPDYREVLRQANAEGGTALLAVEEDRYETDHTVVGYLLARTWGLSETLCEAIRSHHNYSVLDPQATDTERLPDEVCALIAIGVIADHVAGIHLRTREEAQWVAARSRIGAFYGLSEQELDDLVDDLLLELQQAQEETA